MLLRVKIKPNSARDEIIREADGTLKIKIKAQPVEGKANKYLVKYLSGILDIPTSKIQLIKGESSVFKTIEINADEKYVMSKLPQAKDVIRLLIGMTSLGNQTLNSNPSPSARPESFAFQIPGLAESG
jgi:hypothetical protein